MKIFLAVLAATGTLYTEAVTAQILRDASDARLLASGCFQCHGTNGLKGGFGTLAGVEKKDMLDKLKDMSSKPARANIMYPHAQGYTPYELNLIAEYFSRLPKP